VVQQIRAISSHCVEHLGDISLKQQHAARDGRYSLPYLAIGTDADRPSCVGECDLRPAELDIDDFVPIGVDWADGFNLLPLDVPRHHAMIKDPSLINREDDPVESTPAATSHEKRNAGQPRQAKPFHERNGYGEAGRRRRFCAEKNEAGDTDLRLHMKEVPAWRIGRARSTR
jgi:hypothetical protein